MTALTSTHLDLIEDGLIGLRGRDRAPEQKTWATPGDLAKDIDPTTRQTPALQLVDQVLVDVDAGRDDRVIISMPPQEGKSTRVTKVGPVWMLTRNPQRRIVVASYGQDLANEFGRDIRSHITGNHGLDGTLDLGLRVARDNGSVSNWKLAGARGGVRSVGIGGGLVGRPADMMFIDDPVKNRAEAESETYRERAKNFWKGTASTRLAPGAAVVVILTRWHEDDLAGWLLGREDAARWRVINLPALANHDPAKGETDPLGRQPGEWMISARYNEKTGLSRTPEDWEKIRVQTGSLDFEAQYQGNPSPPEGGIVKRDWWRYFHQPLWLDRADGSRVVTNADQVLMSWDMAFKDTDQSDFVVGQVWMRQGSRAYLLDQVRGRWSFVETVHQFRALAAKWPQATLKLVEDKANGTAVINSLQRTVTGIVAEEPRGSKVARLSAVSPLIEAGNVVLPDPLIGGCAWVGDYVEEHAGFPTAKQDDQVDATSQGLNRLLVQPLLEGETWQPDEYDAVDARGWYGSPV